MAERCKERLKKFEDSESKIISTSISSIQKKKMGKGKSWYNRSHSVN